MKLAAAALLLATCSIVRQAQPMDPGDLERARATWAQLELPSPGECPTETITADEDRFRELCQYCGPGRCAAGECIRCAAECVLYAKRRWVVVIHEDAPSGWAHGLAHAWQSCAEVDAYGAHREPRIWCSGGFVERLGGAGKRCAP